MTNIFYLIQFSCGLIGVLAASNRSCLDHFAFSAGASKKSKLWQVIILTLAFALFATEDALETWGWKYGILAATSWTSFLACLTRLAFPYGEPNDGQTGQREHQIPTAAGHEDPTDRATPARISSQPLDMRSNPLTTVEIAAMRKLNRSVDSRWVDWAVDSLVAGHDTPSLRVLAGESAPFNQFEMGSLVDRVLDELQVPLPKTENDAVIVCATPLVKQLASRDVGIASALSALAHLCIERDYLRDLYCFYSLHFAFDDLQVVEYQFYWDGATRENIDDIVTQEAKAWIEKLGSDV